MHLTDSHITFFGLPHPTIRAVFDHLRAIVATSDGEAAVAGWDLVTDPWSAWSDGARNYHLHSEAMSSLALAATTRVLTPPRIPLAYALADRCQRRWEAMPALSLETVILNPVYTTEWLLEQHLTSQAQSTLTIAREMTGRLPQQRDLISDPVSFFERIALSEARTLLTAPLHRFLSTGKSGDGRGMLVDGWREPEEGGCRLQGAIGRLHLLLPQGASVLRCRCLEVPSPELAVYVDGTLVPTPIASDGRTLHIALPQPAPADGRVTTVEFVRNGGTGAPFGISGFEVSAVPRQSEASTPESEAISHGGSRPTVQDDDTAWLQAIVVERSIESFLLLAPDATTALAGLHLALPEVRVAAASALPTNSLDIDSCENFSFIDLPDGAEWPPITSGRFDLIHLHGLANVPNLTERLAWLALHLSYRGIFSGCEQSVQQARDVVSALGRGIDRRFLTFLLDGRRWRAIPHSQWRA